MPAQGSPPLRRRGAEPEPPRDPSLPASGKPAAYVDVFVDDFIGLAQGRRGGRRVRRILLHAVDDVLRPLDAIQAYRLEMGSKLKTRRGGNLYDYWRDSLSKALNTQAEATGSDVLVNCASQEYFGAVDLKALKLRVITPQFMEDKGVGKGPKIVSFFAKKARGAMARYIVQHRVNDPEGLRDFDSGGYAYQPDASTPERPVFVRPYPST